MDNDWDVRVNNIVEDLYILSLHGVDIVLDVL